MGIEYINRYALAIEILKLNPRINIVHKETGIPLSILRQAYTEIHGKSPSKGSLRTSPLFVLKNLSLYKQATFFCVIYELQRVESGISSVHTIISAYKSFLYQLKVINIKKVSLNFSEAWQLAKWLNNKTICLERCHFCKSAKLHIINKQERCSVCRH